MGMSPDYWGKQAWHFIHCVALNYPENPTEEDKVNYMAFLNSLEQVLPCPICGVHFKNNMLKIPVRLDNTQEFFNWTVDMHNEVNKVNDKKVLSYEEARAEVKKNSENKRLDEISMINAQILFNRIKKLKNK